MVHTTTKVARTKRPDARPNGKRRRKERAAAMERAKVEDLRATRIPKSKRKERQVTGVLRKEERDGGEKRVRFLKKLLGQIEALKERKEAGEELGDAQLQKVARLDSVVGELEVLLDVDLASSDEEGGEGEEEEGEEDAPEEAAEEEEEEETKDESTDEERERRKAQSKRKKKRKA